MSLMSTLYLYSLQPALLNQRCSEYNENESEYINEFQYCGTHLGSKFPV